MKVLITAGPTRAAVDAIRYVSNLATGRLGVEISKEAFRRGYDVKLIYGPGLVRVPSYVKRIDVETVQEMLDAVLQNIRDTDIFISSAAVLDYLPRRKDKKIKSGIDGLVIRLYPAPKIVQEARKAARKETKFVLFKLGYKIPKEKLIEEARNLGGDINIANDLMNISDEKHLAWIVYQEKYKNGYGEKVVETRTKKGIAKKIFDILENKLE